MYIQCFNGSLGIWGIPDFPPWEIFLPNYLEKMNWCLQSVAETLQSESCQGFWMNVCTVCYCQANEFDSTLFTMEHVPIFVSPTLYSVFYTPRVFLPFSSTGFSGWRSTFTRGVAAPPARNTSRPQLQVQTSLPSWLININYAMCRLLSWLAERQRSYQINESNSAEVLLMNIN